MAAITANFFTGDFPKGNYGLTWVCGDETVSFCTNALSSGYHQVADSTCKCNGWVDPEKYLTRCFNAKTFSGVIVQFIHHLVNFCLSDGCKVPMLWEVLANESIGVLIGV